MAPKTEALFNLQPICAWPGCPDEPDVQIDYGPAPSGAALGPGLEWQPAPGGGAVNLCGRHAAEFRSAVGAARVRLETPLHGVGARRNA
jgi:hypothetical protein